MNNNNHHKNLQAQSLFLIIDITLETFLHENLVLILQHSIFLPFQAILLYDLQDNTHKPYPLIQTLQNLFYNHILHLVLTLLSSDAQTARLQGNLFSEVSIPTPVPAHVRLPEYYNADHSRRPTPNFADYPIRVGYYSIRSYTTTIRFHYNKRVSFEQ